MNQQSGLVGLRCRKTFVRHELASACHRKDLKEAREMLDAVHIFQRCTNSTVHFLFTFSCRAFSFCISFTVRQRHMKSGSLTAAIPRSLGIKQLLLAQHFILGWSLHIVIMEQIRPRHVNPEHFAGRSCGLGWRLGVEFLEFEGGCESHRCLFADILQKDGIWGRGGEGRILMTF